MTFWPWSLFVMDHRSFYCFGMGLFNKMWLFLWVRLDSWTLCIYFTLVYINLSFWLKHESYVNLKNMSAPWHYKADVSQAKQLCRGMDTSLMIRCVCAFGFVFVTGFLANASSFTVKHAWACPITISLEVCYGYLTELSLISFVHNREETVCHTFVETTIAVSSYCARTC